MLVIYDIIMYVSSDFVKTICVYKMLQIHLIFLGRSEYELYTVKFMVSQFEVPYFVF